MPFRDDFRSVKKSCIKNPGVVLAGGSNTTSGAWRGSWVDFCVFSAAASWRFKGWGVSDLMKNQSFWGSGRPRAAQKPYLLKDFWDARGHPEPQNDRSFIKSLTPHPVNHHRAAVDHFPVSSCTGGSGSGLPGRK